MIKRLAAVAIVVSSLVTTAVVDAQNNTPTPEQQAQSAVNTRKSVVRLFAFNMATISGMARGTIEFDAAVVERNARRIAALAPMLPEAFAAMDTRTFDLETEALPVIWERFDEFQEKSSNLIQGANELADIAARGDQMETIRAAGSIGRTYCGGCHEVFRVQN